MPRQHTPARRHQGDGGALGLEARDGRAFVEPHAEVETGAPQPPGQPGGVGHGAAVELPQGGEVPGRVHLGLDLVTVKQAHVVVQATQQLVVLAQAIDLPRLGRDVHLAGALPVAVDPVPAHGLLDRIEVREAQLFEALLLLREALDPVRRTVRQRRHAEAAVAAARRPAHRHRLESIEMNQLPQ